MTTKLGYADETHTEFILRQAEERIAKLTIERDLANQREKDYMGEQSNHRRLEPKEYLFADGGRKPYRMQSLYEPDRPFPARAITTAFIIFDFLALVGTLIWLVTRGGAQ